MKYMTFNSSCSYAGIANMLALHSIGMEDRDIALSMCLPWLFAHEDGAYLAGPMLQSAKWFNLALHPIGFHLQEILSQKEQIPSLLQGLDCAMLGLKISENSKHAVVYAGKQKAGKLLFINNKWQQSDEPDTLLLDKEDLLTHLDDNVMVAKLQRCSPVREDITPLFAQSCQVLQKWKEEASAFCTQICTPTVRRNALNSLFRAVLLDGITMLDLIGETALAQDIRTLQGKLLQAMRENAPCAVADYLPLDDLRSCVDAYIALIPQQQ